MTKIDTLIGQLERLGGLLAALNADAATTIETTIGYLKTLQEQPVSVYEECCCGSPFDKTVPAYLGGDLARENNTFRKIHQPCREAYQRSLEDAKPHTPEPTPVIVTSYATETGCWNCRGRISLISGDKCFTCRRYRCPSCKECLCGYRAMLQAEAEGMRV